MEGAGVYEFQNWLKALFWFTVAGLVVQEALSAFPPVAAAVSLFWAFFAFLLSLLGVYVSENNQANQPNTSAPPAGPGSLPITFNSPGSASDPAATVVCVVGTWVYDTVHGYDEIHPVKYMMQIGTTSPSQYGYAWDPSWAAICGLLNQVGTVGTLSGQSLPSNGWIIHPLVDGCGSYPTPAPNTE